MIQEFKVGDRIRLIDKWFQAISHVGIISNARITRNVSTDLDYYVYDILLDDGYRMYGHAAKSLALLYIEDGGVIYK